MANDIELASVLSGNRNFEGRISPDVSQNYLAAPAVVVAYALAGTMDVDLEHDALGPRRTARPVRLADIWPSDEEVAALVDRAGEPGVVRGRHARALRRRCGLAGARQRARGHVRLG
ncbi:MAG: aconitase family protein [Gordonibacter pamelaeae]